MSVDDTIRSAYKALVNHRAVAKKLRLPLYYVMFVLGLITTELFETVNA